MGMRLTPSLTAAGLSFPLGAGGLSTMREVCAYEAPLAAAIDGSRQSTITFADALVPERLGWREIVATGFGGDAATPTTANCATERVGSIATYPRGPLATPAGGCGTPGRATVGGPTLAALEVPDAAPVAERRVSSCRRADYAVAGRAVASVRQPVVAGRRAGWRRRLRSFRTSSARPT